MEKFIQTNELIESPFPEWHTVRKADLYEDADTQMFYVSDLSETQTALMIAREFNVYSAQFSGLSNPEFSEERKRQAVRQVAQQYYNELITLREQAGDGLIDYDLAFRASEVRGSYYVLIRTDIPQKEVSLSEEKIGQQLRALIRCVKAADSVLSVKTPISMANIILNADGIRYSPVPLFFIMNDDGHYRHESSPLIHLSAIDVCRCASYYFPESECTKKLIRHIDANPNLTDNELIYFITMSYEAAPQKEEAPVKKTAVKKPARSNRVARRRKGSFNDTMMILLMCVVVIGSYAGFAVDQIQNEGNAKPADSLTQETADAEAAKSDQFSVEVKKIRSLNEGKYREVNNQKMLVITNTSEDQTLDFDVQFHFNYEQGSIPQSDITNRERAQICGVGPGMSVIAEGIVDGIVNVWTYTVEAHESSVDYSLGNVSVQWGEDFKYLSVKNENDAVVDQLDLIVFYEADEWIREDCRYRLTELDEIPRILEFSRKDSSMEPKICFIFSEEE